MIDEAPCVTRVLRVDNERFRIADRPQRVREAIDQTVVVDQGSLALLRSPHACVDVDQLSFTNRPRTAYGQPISPSR